MSRVLICSYCSKDFVLKQVSGFGVVQCDCDQYPILCNILYLQKDDQLLNKRLVELVQEKKYEEAVSLALSSSLLIYRRIVFFAWILRNKYQVLIPERLLLQVLRWSSTNARSWFDYLLSRQTKPDLTFVRKNISPMTRQNVLVDVGCGVGFLLRELKLYPNTKFYTHIGIDKNFMTLMIARLYHPEKDFVLICTDIEHGLPIKDSSALYVVFLDCFAWIFNKVRAITESERILKTRGKFILVNVHQESLETATWGYGIKPKKLQTMLSTKFRGIQFFGNLSNTVTSVTMNQLSVRGYSCIAIKK